jgi:uncharacterized protein YkwD
MMRAMNRFALLQRLSATLALAAAMQSAAAATAAPAYGEGFVRHLAQLINEYRERQGLAPLDVAVELIDLAGEHSQDMAQRQQLSHEGFRVRLQRAGSRLCVENVGWNHRTPEALLDGWRRSPAHHRNLLEPQVSRMGIAVATRYVTFFACR